MEKLRNDALHASIHSAMEMWMEGIRKVQARRKEEIVNATNRHRNGGPRYQEEKGKIVEIMNEGLLLHDHVLVHVVSKSFISFSGVQ